MFPGRIGKHIVRQHLRNTSTTGSPCLFFFRSSRNGGDDQAEDDHAGHVGDHPKLTVEFDAYDQQCAGAVEVEVDEGARIELMPTCSSLCTHTSPGALILSTPCSSVQTVQMIGMTSMV